MNSVTRFAIENRSRCIRPGTKLFWSGMRTVANYGERADKIDVVDLFLRAHLADYEDTMRLFAMIVPEKDFALERASFFLGLRSCM